ncbi:hypothetical protein [Nocardioides astragali]|uniref:Uncharacterized protein n=1 Tax=Nocardioides astragali TaxID=1776736 RepID=A0ABW2NB15_9ACTN|nr:hypothetical protein [Nocardioides astragali]
MSQFNRRTLVRGAAWSIPVVAVAAHSPAFATSLAAPQPSGVTACKQPGGPNGPNCQGYRMTLNLTIQPGDTWTIDFTELRNDGTDVMATASQTTFLAVSSTSSVLTFALCGNSSPSHFGLTLRYSATNDRTGETTTNLGGTFALSGIKNC